MPVVISLLNSFTGVAAACGGFLYDNKVMLTGGILVGAAGTLLTILMCKAMNRSLKNVLIGSFGATANNKMATAGEQGAYKEINLPDAAMVMNYANKVMIVPGYGLAVAQAQHTCHELEKILDEKNNLIKIFSKDLENKHSVYISSIQRFKTDIIQMIAMMRKQFIVLRDKMLGTIWNEKIGDEQDSKRKTAILESSDKPKGCIEGEFLRDRENLLKEYHTNILNLIKKLEKIIYWVDSKLFLDLETEIH